MFALIVHGGAGNWPADKQLSGLAGVERALDVGRSILERGGAAIDAVEQAVEVLEDDPTFNAGTGSHPNSRGEVEMDAIIVDGAKGLFGAVAAIRNVRHPVGVARKVMTDTPHCMLVGDGATRYAHANGFEFIATELLTVEQAHDDGDTVGAVALDTRGRIAAATSTGGTRNKLPGRVGDSPLFGAGAFADADCGVSCTGVGEYIMRVLLAKTVAEAISRGVPPELAAHGGISRLEHVGGNGGVIALDREGRVGFCRNTPAMPVAFIDGRGARSITP